MEMFADIVGTHFRGSEAKRVCNALDIDDAVELVREPENAYDANAVACYVGEQHIGYIPAANNAQLALALDDEIACTAKVIGWNGNKPTLMIEWED